MSKPPVIQAAAYCLIHAPSLVRHGTTCHMEAERNHDSAWLSQVPGRLRTFEQALTYAPHQVYIGNMSPWELASRPRPWHAHQEPPERWGPYGEIMPEDEFYGAMALADSFQLVRLEQGTAARIRGKLAEHRCFGPAEAAKIGEGVPLADLQRLVEAGALPLYLGDELAGCVKAGHETDPNLNAHIMLENLAAKASAAVVLKHLLRAGAVNPGAVDYLIECSEEAVGDMNQRGGGNIAKAVGELAGCVSATGSDVRAFCAAPCHAIVQGAALVKAGVYNRVAVFAGGSTAKLGMNSREHVGKGLPVLEDVLGAFAVLLGPDDGVNPVVRLDVIGRHPIGAGAAPQAVMQAVVVDPLTKAGLKLKDVDVYAAELQNPEITEAAGAGDVPRANLRMVGALAMRQGELIREELDGFTAKHGVPGFAPTQGHIPSGVPILGHARDAIRAGRIRRAMVIGKGSLFLGRMTNLFDGISLLVEQNPGRTEDSSAAIAASSTVSVSPRRLRIGITVAGSELGDDEVLAGAAQAERARPDLEIVRIGGTADEAHREMERMLSSGDLAAVVTMHYNFPLGVASVGRVVTPGRGREMLLSTVTGAASANRIESLVRGALYGQAVARSLGWTEPSIGLLNLDGAAVAERMLRQLSERGCGLLFAGSGRADGGALMRGNDVLAGTADVLVTDTLTGNALMKIMSALNTGGSYEAVGYGYGPGVGPDFPWIVGIVSRASGAPVIANALTYAGDMARANLPQVMRETWSRAVAAGLPALLADIAEPTAVAVKVASGEDALAPKPVSHEIAGIDVLQLESAVSTLISAGVFSTPGMGCTGPVVLVAPEDEAPARAALKKAGFLS